MDATSQDSWVLLFFDDFNDGDASGWTLVRGWTVEQEDDGNYVLSGTGFAPFASTGNPLWYDYSITSKIKLLTGGTFINFRVNNAGTFSRYFVAVDSGSVVLNKQIGNDFFNNLAVAPATMTLGVWHVVEVVGKGNQIGVLVDGQQLLSYEDRDNPLLRGSISLETHPDSHVHFDDVEVRGEPVPDIPDWSPTNGPDGGIVRAFARNRFTGTLFVGAPNAGIFRSVDGGRRWQKSNKGLGYAGYIFHIQPDPVDPDTVYVVFVNGGAFKSTDDGVTWSSINNGLAGEKPYSISVDPTDPRVLYLGTQDGKIFRSTDSGTTWVKESNGLPVNGSFSVSKILVNPADPNIVYASTGWWDDSPGIGIFKSTDGGGSWKPINTGLGPLSIFSTLAMDPTNPQVLFAAGTRIYGGPPWSGVFKTANGGDSWKQVIGDNQTAGCSGAVAVAVSPKDSSIVYAGVGSCIFRSSDGGERWNNLTVVPTIPIVTHIMVDESGVVYVTGYYGGVNISFDEGNSWVYSTLGFNATRVFGLAVDPSDSNVVYAGTRGDGQFKTTNGGHTWKRFELGFDFFGGASWAIQPQDSATVFAGTYYTYPGRIYKTTNAGKDWRKVLDTGQTISFGDQKFVNSIALDPLNSQTLYGAVLASGIYKSVDGGEKWRTVNTGLGSLFVTSLAIDPRSAGTIYAGTLQGGVYRSANGGESWSPANTGLSDTDIWSLAMDPSNSEILYAGSGNPAGAVTPGTIITETKGKGKIFKSTDGGQHWSLAYSMPVTDSIWAIIVDPNSPQTIYAAAEAILMSADGGTSWVQGGRLIYDTDNNVEPPYIRSLAMDGKGNTLYAGTIEGGVFRAVLHPAAGITLTNPPAQEAEAGSSALHTLLLRNTGNTADSFDLSAQSSQGWSVSMPASVGPVNYGEEVRIQAQIAVPSGAPTGLADTLNIKAISRLDPKVASVTQATTTVTQPEAVSGLVLDEQGQRAIAGAIVRVRATTVSVLTDETGHFTIPKVVGSVDLTISEPGYYTAEISAAKGQNNITLNLKSLPSGDNQQYSWLSHWPGWRTPNNCGNCHLSIVEEWLGDAHSHSAAGRLFLSVYNGTDAQGRQGVSPGLKLDLPHEPGNCAMCHAPLAAASTQSSADMNTLTNSQKDGVSCDFCHKISDVTLDSVSRLPDPSRPGVQSIQLKRPFPPDQVFLGPMDDVPNPDSYSPLYRRSAYCAPCHSGSFLGTPIYQSYPEWLTSPYARNNVECQDCHMPSSGATNIAPGQGGLERDPDTLFGHTMPGAADVNLLKRTVTLDVTTAGLGDLVRLYVSLTNSGAGHHVPTDHPMRNMLLVVTARDRSGQLLGYAGSDVIPAWGGDLSGLPGRGYAKILTDSKTSEAPAVSYWRPTAVLSDTRLPALATDRAIYDFIAPGKGSEAQIDVKVLFRRTFQTLAKTKGWDIPDIVMAERRLSLVTDTGSNASVQYMVPAGGANASSTLGKEDLQVGYARLGVTSGATPYGTAVFSLKQNGTIVSEAAVPASPPTTAARAFIDYRTGVPIRSDQPTSNTVDVYTGLALANCGTGPASLTFQLHDSSGALLTTGHGTLAQNAHTALFINELQKLASDFVLPPNFSTVARYASMDVTSSQPVSILALRLTATTRNETLLTTTPVADLMRSPDSSSLYFPQFVDGGGYRSSLFLMNTSSSVESGVVRFFDSEGAPLLVHLDGDSGVHASSIPYTIPAGGFTVLNTDGLSDEVSTGSVQIRPNSGTHTPMGAGIFSYALGGTLVTESGIPSAIPTTHARIYIDRTNGHSTGLAMAAPQQEPLSVTLKAYSIDGVTPAGSASLKLRGNGQTAKFDSQFIPSLPADFTGVLDISSPSPFVALTLRSLANERGDFLLTTFPVADFDRPAPSPIVFPQIADGGGYRTEFILISAGGVSSSTLSFFGDNGSQLVSGK